MNTQKVSAWLANLPAATLILAAAVLPSPGLAQCCGGLDSGHNPGSGANDVVNASVRQSDGKIIIGGAFTSFNGSTRYYIARLTASGANDTYYAAVNGPVFGLALDGNERLTAVGAFTYPSSGIARFLSNGSSDSSFIAPAIDSYPLTVAYQPSEGKILIGGYHTYVGGYTRPRIARLNSNGSVDSTFNAGSFDAGGVFTINLADGLWIGGSFASVGGYSRGRIAKLNPSTGSIDASWPSSGLTLANGTVYAIELDQSARRFIGGSFSQVNGASAPYLARLDLNGNATAPATAPNGTVLTIKQLQQSGDDIVVGGEFTVLGTTTSRAFARMSSSMSVMCAADPGFTGGSGGAATSVKTITHVSLYPDIRKVFVGGNFTNFSGTARSRVAQLCLECCQ